MKAARLFIWSVYLILLYALWVPVIAFTVASWPFRMVAWILVGSDNESGLCGLVTRWQLAVAKAMDGQLAAANGFPDIVAYRKHKAAEKAERVKKQQERQAALQKRADRVSADWNAAHPDAKMKTTCYAPGCEPAVSAP
jgi:hypothetical protein